jgi:hypothetical protein
MKARVRLPNGEDLERHSLRGIKFHAKTPRCHGWRRNWVLQSPKREDSRYKRPVCWWPSSAINGRPVIGSRARLLRQHTKHSNRHARSKKRVARLPGSGPVLGPRSAARLICDALKERAWVSLFSPERGNGIDPRDALCGDPTSHDGYENDHCRRDDQHARILRANSE